jgi:hypothetical protein
MNETVLGKLAEESGIRDAIHVATITAIATHELRPGDRVGLINGNEAVYGVDVIGIVDPFLTELVKKGQVFQLCLFPRSTVIHGNTPCWTMYNSQVQLILRSRKSTLSFPRLNRN